MTISQAWTHQGNSSGAFPGPPDKATLHSTEGGSIEGAIAAYTKNNSWPTKTVDYRNGKRRVCTHLPLTVGARALRNARGGIQTNLDRTTQYELVGHAAQILDEYREQDWLDLGRDVIGPDCRQVGIPLRCTVTMPTYPPPNGERLGQESTRLRGKACDDYQGILGHCNWDENTHGDPGPLTAKHYRGHTVSAMDLILEGAGATTQPQPKDWLMALTDKQQDELLTKVREIHRETVQSIEPDKAKGIKASGRWLLAKIAKGEKVT